MKNKQIIALLNEDQQFLDSGGGVSEAHIPHQCCALPPSPPPGYKMLTEEQILKQNHIPIDEILADFYNAYKKEVL